MNIRTRTPIALAITGVLLLAAASPAMAERGELQDGATRLSGADRVATAVTTSRAAFLDPTKAVVLASANNYADAIGGGLLATELYAPVLLVGSDGLRPDLLEEIDFHLSEGGTVTILGGNAAVPATVEQELVGLGYAVERIAGADRFETAAKVAAAAAAALASTSVDVTSNPLYLVSGTNFPDGLAVAPLAAWEHGQILLSDGDSLPPATARYLAENDPQGTRTIAVGGAAARAVPAAPSIVGEDRYDTAAMVASRFDGPFYFSALATGENWPDALVVSAAVGALNGPLLLTNGTDLGPAGPATDALVRDHPVRFGLVAGGEGSISAPVFDDFAARIARGRQS